MGQPAAAGELTPPERPRSLQVAIVGSRGYPHVYSGYETLVGELAPRLAARGHQVTVYCHRKLFPERPSQVDGVQLVYVPGLHTKSLSQPSHSLLGTLHVLTRRFDAVLYVNSANGPFGALLRAAGIPSAINVDGQEWLRPKWRGLGSKYFRVASLLATKLFDEVITDADAMADVYRTEFGAASTTIAYGSTPAYSSEPARLAELQLAPRGYYLVVGRLVPDNNADLVVREFARSRTARKLVVVGDAPYRNRFGDAVRSIRDQRIVFPGYVRDQQLLLELYCNAFAYIHGHQYGGTNPSLLHALAFGCCVLALDTPFSREVLVDEDHGIYFHKSPGCLAQLIDHIDHDEDRVDSLRRTARSRIAKAYTWERIVDQYEELLLRLGGRRSSSRMA